MEVASYTLELCGRLADVGGAVLRIDAPAGGLTAGELKAHIASVHPALAREMAGRRIMVCVNDVIVDDSHAVFPHDRVAIFPPLSGG